jgi:hypothetical protein
MTEDKRTPDEDEAELEQQDTDVEDDVEAHALPQPPTRPMNSL